jgi:hypothetical protein
MIRGLTKNTYAGCDYQPWLPALGAFMMLVGYCWPIAALFVLRGPAWWLNLACVIVMLTAGWDQTRFGGGRRWYGWFIPIGMTIFSYMLLRSMVVTHATGGITWRGTHYPLAELKRNKV